MKTLIRTFASAFLALMMLLPLRLHAQTNSSTAPPRYEDIFGHALPAQKHLRVYGQDIAYYDMGTAKSGQPVLVLLHGYGSQADVDFGPSLPLLAKSRRVIALDQIGAGRSSKPYIRYHVGTYVEWLGEFLRTLGVTKFDLAGESLGGWTAALYAERCVQTESDLPKPSHLVLEDAAGFQAPSGGSASMHMTVSTVAETAAGLKAVFADPALVTPEVAKRRFMSKMEANDAFAAATFSTNTLVLSEAAGPAAGAIAVPTLVIWGAEDKTVPRAMGEGYAKAIPGAKMVLIPQSGHVPSLEQPKAFVEAVEGFLK